MTIYDGLNRIILEDEGRTRKEKKIDIASIDIFRKHVIKTKKQERQYFNLELNICSN